jgi:FAD-dependent urate hydroxylase
MRVTVVGAGVGGLAVAAGLHRRGHDVVVVEQTAGLRTGGAALGIWFNGSAALARLGHRIDADAPLGGRRIDVLSLRRWDGSVLSELDAVRLCAKFGVPAFTIPRRALLEQLAAGLPPGAIRFAARCTGVRQDPHGAVTRLADGTELVSDVVVGADGCGSALRQALVGPGQARSTGWMAVQGLSGIPMRLTSGTVCLSYVGPGGYCGMMPAGDGLLQWWFEVRQNTGFSAADPVLTHELLRKAFGDWADPVPELLGLVRAVAAEEWHYVRHVVPRTLGRGRVVLIGDAVHAMPPQLGQGGNQTLEDALVLCEELSRRDDDPSAAIERYQRARRRKAATASWLSARSLTEDARHPWLKVKIPAVALGTAFSLVLRAVSNCL